MRFTLLLAALSVCLALNVGFAQTIGQAEYFFDTDPGQGNATAATIAPGTNPSFSIRIPTGLGGGLHRWFIRYRETGSNWSGNEARYFYVFQATGSNFQARTVTELQYWFDTNPPTTVDLTDGATASYATRVSTAGLAPGLHRFYTKYRDNTGTYGGADAGYFFIMGPQPSPEIPVTLSGAEYFINYDPGPGHGIALTPDDGVWDEPAETVTDTLPSIPSGRHWVGVRYRDALGKWSPTETDTLFVGPILIIHIAQPNVVLDWITGQTADKFYIQRSPSSNGTYAVIDSTTAHTYTDVGVLNSNLREFYHITQHTTGFSDFRWPAQSAILPTQE